MKMVLLDECVPRKLNRFLANCNCQTVPEAGFAGTANGRLLLLAETAGFDIFVTMDKGVQYQQNFAGRKIAIVVFRARSNRLADLLPHVDVCNSVIRSILPGEIVRVGN